MDLMTDSADWREIDSVDPDVSTAVAEGKTATTAALGLTALIAAGFPGVQFGVVGLNAAASRGFSVALHRGGRPLVQVQVPRTSALQIERLNAVEDSVVADPMDEHTVYIDPQKSGRTAVIQGNVCVIVDPRAQGLRLTVAERVNAADRGFYDTARAWLADADDAWLLAEISWSASLPGAYQQAAAAGDVLRLWLPASPERRRAATSAPFVRPPMQRAALDWASSLDSNALEATTAACASAISELRDDLTDSAISSEDVLNICRRRDALESVLVVLAAVAPSRVQSLAASLTDLDAQGHRLAETVSIEADDERLARISIGDPDAWWVFPVTGSLSAS